MILLSVRKEFFTMTKLFSLTFLLILCGNTVAAGWFSPNEKCEAPCVPGDESIMRPKAHGTSETPVQDNLRWGCDHDLADRIANYNRHYAGKTLLDGLTIKPFFCSETLTDRFISPIFRTIWLLALYIFSIRSYSWWTT